MRPIPIVVLLALLISQLLMPAIARADGVIIVDPPGCDPPCPEPVLVADSWMSVAPRVGLVADQIATT